MKSTNPESLSLRVGKAEIGLEVDRGCLRSIGGVTVSGTALRSYWTNKSQLSGIINDVPSESRLEPKEWGEVVVE